ncbi:hypothetical protein BGLA2_1050022 [Burkholderia gladioli]|nr:hypothetical protein BGLA2_1050022 [Burkholderia gladioli]
MPCPGRATRRSIPSGPVPGRRAAFPVLAKWLLIHSPIDIGTLSGRTCSPSSGLRNLSIAKQLYFSQA